MTLDKKVAAARKWLGAKWCLHPASTYDAKIRQQRDAVVLRPVIIKAMKEKRL